MLEMKPFSLFSLISTNAWAMKPIILSADPICTVKLHGVYAYREKLSSPKFRVILMQCSKVVYAGGSKYGSSTFKHSALLAIMARFLVRMLNIELLAYISTSSMALQSSIRNLRLTL